MPDLTLKVPAVDKLLDYAAAGVGAIAGPMLATWRASREGRARVLAAEADAEVRLIQAETEGESLRLIAEAQSQARTYVSPHHEAEGQIEIGAHDIQQYMEFQTKKRLSNLTSIVNHAADSLSETEVRDHHPDPDWAGRFFDVAQDVSSEELQKLWARILAGEVETPGRTSLRTLSILRNMSQREAMQFLALMQFRVNNFIFDDGLKGVSGDRFESPKVHLSHVGLLYSGWGVSPVVKLKHDGTFTVAHHDHLLIIEGTPDSEVDVMGQATSITSSGLELAALCKHEPHLHYLSRFASFLATRHCVLKLAPIVAKTSRGFKISEIHVIEPFAGNGKSDEE